jgi:hypothetical protein
MKRIFSQKLHKLNPYYFSGDEIEEDVRHVARMREMINPQA